MSRPLRALVFVALSAVGFAGPVAHAAGLAGTYVKACANGGNVYDDLSCAERALNSSERDLNAIYGKLYASTQFKEALQESQKAWLAYREKQCNGYVAAEASQSQGAGSGLSTKDCLVAITEQRVEYLKTLLEK